MTEPTMPDNGFLRLITIAPGIIAGFTTRGDIDGSPYSGINLCHYTGDSERHVIRSRERFAAALHLPVGNIVIPRQTHSTNCTAIDRLPVDPATVDNTDALVTTLDRVVIGVSTADCVPVLLADPVNRVIGVAHAGWRGAIGGVVDNALDSMLDHGADMPHITAAMGPCICAECFEVGAEVAGLFPASVVDHGYEKPHVDLPAYITHTLKRRGVTDDRILMPPACTRCRPDTYFSARALGINSGRIFTFIWTNPEIRFMRDEKRYKMTKQTKATEV